MMMGRIIPPRKPSVYAHPTKIHLQEHVGVQVYLVKDDEEKYGVRDARRPREDIRSRREKDRDQSENRSDKFDVAYTVPKHREKYFSYVEERHVCFEHRIGRLTPSEGPLGSS